MSNDIQKEKGLRDRLILIITVIQTINLMTSPVHPRYLRSIACYKVTTEFLAKVS